MLSLEVQSIIVDCGDAGSLAFHQDVNLPTLRAEFAESGHAAMFVNSTMEPRGVAELLDQLRSLDRSANNQIVPGFDSLGLTAPTCVSITSMMILSVSLSSYRQL